MNLHCIVDADRLINRCFNQVYIFFLFTGGDLSNELVRHFLIECTQKGVRLKGCPNEPYFGELLLLPNLIKVALNDQHCPLLAHSEAYQ